MRRRPSRMSKFSVTQKKMASFTCSRSSASTIRFVRSTPVNRKPLATGASSKLSAISPPRWPSVAALPLGVCAHAPGTRSQPRSSSTELTTRMRLASPLHMSLPFLPTICRRGAEAILGVLVLVWRRIRPILRDHPHSRPVLTRLPRDEKPLAHWLAASVAGLEREPSLGGAQVGRDESRISLLKRVAPRRSCGPPPSVWMSSSTQRSTRSAKELAPAPGLATGRAGHSDVRTSYAGAVTRTEVSVAPCPTREDRPHSRAPSPPLGWWERRWHSRVYSTPPP